MRLTNIFSYNKDVYLFCRDEQGVLTINKDDTHYPYYYEPNPDGKYVGFDGKVLKKMVVSKPSDIYKNKSNKSYESDIKFTNRYMIDKIGTIEKTNLKCAFIDIETLSEELPNVQQAKDPISCISVYNYSTNNVNSFFLMDYQNEYSMITAFVDYVQKERFDIWLIWNGHRFDMPYLIQRYPDFSKKVSPIGYERYFSKDMFYPAGISIIDYMELDKKITLNRKRSYALDSRLEETLGRGKQLKKVKFGVLSEEIRTRCENDVKDMAEMEDKLQYIKLWDGIRRLTKVHFEDYSFNSRSIDQLLLQEAKKKNIILPMKPMKSDNPKDFEGGFREIFTKGALFDRGEYDLAGAYLNAIIELCLDPSNVRETEEPNTIPVNITDRATNEVVTTYYIKQDPTALLPTIAKKLLEEKNKFKKLKNDTNPELPEYKDIEEKYKSWKSLALSAWGVIGNKYFRYYDHRVAGMITSVIRDSLHYVLDEIRNMGYTVDYIDTDGVILEDDGVNIVDLLNELLQDWSNKRFGRDTEISFDYEGHYEKLLLLALCRYKGYLRTEEGLEEKTVGIEAKRKDSTIFMQGFQTELIEKILNKVSKEEIVTWIKSLDIKKLPIAEISFPCKLGRHPSDYKNTPIFLRALRSTPDFNKKVGDPYYYIFMEGKDEKKKDLVMAFDEDHYSHIDRDKINWEIMYKRNILMKIQTIFEAMGWNLEEVL